ncbi:MAG: glycosyltransferase [Bacteroidota bacterium]|nr:glycosyltransferase [Bacteroidota bacterium]
MGDTTKKILYISYDGLTDPLGQSQVLPYLQQLAEHGYCFTILSFEKKDRLKKEVHIIKDILKVSGIGWVPLTFTSRPPILSKMYDRFRMKQTAVSLYKKEKFDLIHCRSYVAAETGLLLKKKFGTPFLFDMRGFWADEKVDNGQWDLNKFFYRLLYKYYKQKEKELLSGADGIISLTEASKNHLLQKKIYRDLSIKVIPCCADLEHFNYLNISLARLEEVKKELKIPHGAKVITYLGSIGGWYMVKEMFLFLKMVQKQYPDHIMLFLTKDDPAKVRREAMMCGIETSKIFIRYAGRKELPVFWP